ncbi:hypothetical protein TRVL_08099 [Trypanosoma vivax]|nr:hypothetical protein TRVL_08099 [Trypanosoma vivax]
MGGGDLLPFFENKQVELMDLQNATNSTETPKSGSYIRAFEAAQECFQNKRRALGESRRALHQQCAAVGLQIRRRTPPRRRAYVLPLQQVALMAQRRTLASRGARFHISSDTLKATKPTAASS